MAIDIKTNDSIKSHDCDNELDIKSIIEESFEGENGMLEVCKAQYAQAKKGSLPHAVWIINHLIGKDEQGEEIKEFRIIEEIVE